MNQHQYLYLKRKHELNQPPSYSVPRQNKSKQKPNGIASKSFSQSFLNDFSSRKSVRNAPENKVNRQENVSSSMNSKNKKLSDHNIFVHKSDKKKALLTAFDSKMLKESIKAKSQVNKVNVSYPTNQKYLSIDKSYRQKLKHNAQINNPYKNKSQTNFMELRQIKQQQDIKQKKIIKSVSSTTKNEQMKHKIISHLQGKNKKQPNNQVSHSQRKKVSEKIQAKLNQLKKTQQQQFHMLTKNDRASLERLSHQDLNKLKNSSLVSSQKPQTQERLQYKYAFRTKKGRNLGNMNKPNQDSILVKQNISKRDLHMIAVADGHGTSGHLVSQFVVKTLSKLFSQQVNQIIKFQQQTRKHCQNSMIQGTLFLPKIYDKIQTDLSCSDINSATSGCTLVNVIIQKNQILCANVGDSRAILARQLDKKNWELIYLSEDHKPSSQLEKKRILKCGGRIHTFKGEKGQNLGPLRVWLPNQNIQGLAMTRSFGDNISKSVGVTHKPEMIKVKIDEKDKFILVASDGVWEFISNQQILQLIAPYYKQKKLEQACDALLKYSYQKWTQGDDSVVDDISFVLVFLHC